MIWETTRQSKKFYSLSRWTISSLCINWCVLLTLWLKCQVVCLFFFVARFNLKHFQLMTKDWGGGEIGSERKKDKSCLKFNEINHFKGENDDEKAADSTSGNYTTLPPASPNSIVFIQYKHDWRIWNFNELVSGLCREEIRWCMSCEPM